jgi:hypothetical protein
MGRMIDERGVRLSALIEGNEAGRWVTFAHSLATDLTLFAQPQPAAFQEALLGFPDSLEGRR